METVYTTESMIERLVELGTWAYKKLNKNTPEGRKLYRHEKVRLDDDIEFCSYREYATYKMCELLREQLPYAEIECVLSDTESTITIEVSDSEQQKLNSHLYKLVKQWEDFEL